VSSSLSPEEIRAAAETHDELGPAYRDAVIESFLDKVGRDSGRGLAAVPALAAGVEVIISASIWRGLER
jgi:hypothetical protein